MLKFENKKLKLYSIVAFVFFSMVFFNCKGFYLMLPINVQHIYTYIYYLCSIISLVVFIVVFKKNRELYNGTFKFIIATLFLFFLPQLIYTYFKYNQNVLDFARAANQYTFIIWTIPILYVFYKEEGYSKFIRLITNIVTIGYIIILINVLLKYLLNFSFFNIEKWNFTNNGTIRILNLSVIAPLTLIYNWNKIIEKKGKVENWISLIIVLVVTIIIEQTRMKIIITLITLFCMFLFKKRDKKSRMILFGLTASTVVLILITGIFNIFLSQFSESNNGISTLYRINELNFYLEKFDENKLFGIGLVPQTDIYDIYGISKYGDMNPNDIGIFGSLGLLGMGVVIIFIFPLFRWWKIYRKVSKDSVNSKNSMLLLGILIYTLLSSTTLIILNYERIALYPFFIAIFEYHNYLLIKEKREDWS